MFRRNISLLYLGSNSNLREKPAEAYSSIPKKESVLFSETSDILRTRRCCNAEECTLHSYCHENLKSNSENVFGIWKNVS
jgi:hypothetical protein